MGKKHPISQYCEELEEKQQPASAIFHQFDYMMHRFCVNTAPSLIHISWEHGSLRAAVSVSWKWQKKISRAVWSCASCLPPGLHASWVRKIIPNSSHSLGESQETREEMVLLYTETNSSDLWPALVITLKTLDCLIDWMTDWNAL